MQTALGHMETFPTLFLTRAIKIKTIVRCHLYAPKFKSLIAVCCGGFEKNAPSRLGLAR